MHWTRTRIVLATGCAATLLAVGGLGVGLAAGGPAETADPPPAAPDRDAGGTLGRGGAAATETPSAQDLVVCLQQAGIDLDLSAGLPRIGLGSDARGVPQLSINGKPVEPAVAVGAALACRDELTAVGSALGEDLDVPGLLADALPRNWQDRLGQVGSCALTTGPDGAADDVTSWARTLAACLQGS